MNQEILSLGNVCVRLVSSKTERRSFLGGKPMVSSSFEWPRKNAKPLGFIAQLDLKEINSDKIVDWLPNVGRLLFFYDQEEWPWGFDPKDRGGWSVIYDSGSSDLNLQDTPPDMNAEHIAPTTKYIERELFTSYPDGQRVDFDAIGLSEDDEYFDFLHEHFGDEPRHQVGGFPSPVQNDCMEEECQLVSGGVYCGNPEGYSSKQAEMLRAKENDWRLLFQIDSDDEAETMWGDMGMLYFWIRESDARKYKFSDVWMVLQCG